MRRRDTIRSKQLKELVDYARPKGVKILIWYNSAGEWNTSRVVVRGTEVEHWLNGSKVLSYTLDSPALREAIARSKFKAIERFGKPQQGLFLLQDHGDAVCYRNVKVRALTGRS